MGAAGDAMSTPSSRGHARRIARYQAAMAGLSPLHTRWIEDYVIAESGRSEWLGFVLGALASLILCGVYSLLFT